MNFGGISIDFYELSTIMIEIILSKHINFLETLSEEICSEVLKDQRVKNINLQIDKLDIIEKTSSVGVKTFKERIK